MSWFSKFSFTYLIKQISPYDHFVFKMSRRNPSFQHYKRQFCSIFSNGDIQQTLRGNFFLGHPVV